MNLPYDYSIIDSVTPDENMKGWKEFAELLKISTNGYQGASVEITGEKNAEASDCYVTVDNAEVVY